MTPGEIAWLIVAVAILLFLGSISFLIFRITQPLKNVLKDVDIIAREADDLLANTNVLLEDVNGKVEVLDPAFQAVADLGESVSGLNDAARNLTTQMGTSNMSKMGSMFATFNGMRKRS
ncbi:DUF948 domain-containing protein [Weissella ceti]|uniref:DUF948 domain-containing protein n=1 Tax=Weissella ceti TaxID=759620 RepID=A0ABT3E2U7_9LACO|nr:DUF948 domain-containing protein [Weissella ceti]MCW0952728.1 DUF948 domain-containing protein [Weissella ceti]QVK12429.1 DUF948 domain-containing protein [Weissella ceti]